MFRDEIENLLYNISDFEKGARNKTINSRGRARILDANSRETFRDREFSPMSVQKLEDAGQGSRWEGGHGTQGTQCKQGTQG